MLERRAPLTAALTMALGSLWLCGCGPDIEYHTGEPQGECHAILRSIRNGSAEHVEKSSAGDYPMNLTVIGDHYQVWAAYATYDFPVPVGYLVHDLEHGAVVFFYDCEDGCPDEVAEVQGCIDALPADPRCDEAVMHQTILVPRPGLGARW